MPVTRKNSCNLLPLCMEPEMAGCWGGGGAGREISKSNERSDVLYISSPDSYFAAEDSRVDGMPNERLAI